MRSCLQSCFVQFSRLLVIVAAFFCGVAFASLGPGDFTVIALPDTQNYSEFYPHIFNSQTDWIVRNRSALNIKFVLGLGDIVNNGSNIAQQQNADAAVRTLDEAVVPYLLALGNHDYKSASPKTRDATTFNNYFGPFRYAGKSWYRGSYAAGSNSNFYGVFTIGNTQYLVMALEFYPRNSVLSWASSVIAANHDKKVILIMHSFLLGSRRVGLCDTGNAEAYGISADNDGQEMWAKLISKHSNIMMVLNGHFQGWGRRADLGVNGNRVNQILSDYQKWENGGGGYLRIMIFRPLLNRVDVKTYSPYYNKYLTDSGNQFSMTLFSTAPGASGTGKIAGRVRSRTDCKSLSGVRISSSFGSTTTDTDGMFTLTGPSGAISISAGRSGWQSSTVSTQIDPGLSAQVDVFLNPAGVNVSSPASGATINPSTHFVASATASGNRRITHIRIYVDSRSRYGIDSNRLDTWLTLALGWRNVTVQAWDSEGGIYRKSLSVNVK